MRALTLAILALGIASPAVGQDRCIPPKAVSDVLWQSEQQVRRFQGLSNKYRILVEVYANPETGKWTVVMTHPQGLACLVDHGEGSEMFPDRAFVRGEGS